jgi:hypothetical protein
LERGASGYFFCGAQGNHSSSRLEAIAPVHFHSKDFWISDFLNKGDHRV